MKTYRVGGCVRDRLLGWPTTDTDWVVTGATEDDMLAAGFKAIGRDFPVFLHPQTRQEYALARSERKTGPGYRGFSVSFTPDTRLEDDLQRRDLTINAMAEDDQGELIDPFGGQQDVEKRLLRHVSEAFVEDPVRVLRLARFAARYHHLGFSVAPETRQLVTRMGESGELDSLVAERVWQEMSRALAERNPPVFFETLRQCNVLHLLFPEIDSLFGVPQNPIHHPEIDTGIHVMMALQKSADLEQDVETRFAVLTHDLGKASTAEHMLPSHHGHEKSSRRIVQEFCQKWKIPRPHTELALITAEFHTHVHRALELKPVTVLKLFKQTDAFRKPERFRKMLNACLADARGRSGFDSADYPQANYLWDQLQLVQAIDSTPFREQGLEGKLLGDMMDRARIEAIKNHQHELRQH